MLFHVSAHEAAYRKVVVEVEHLQGCVPAHSLEVVGLSWVEVSVSPVPSNRVVRFIGFAMPERQRVGAVRSLMGTNPK